MKIQKFWEKIVDEAFKLGAPYVVAISSLLAAMMIIIGLIVASLVSTLTKFIRADILLISILVGLVVYIGYCGTIVIRNAIKNKDGEI